MSQFYFKKTQYNSLVPADEAAEKMLSKIKVGDACLIDVRRPRNLQHTRKFWKLMEIVCQNQDYYTTKEQVCNAIKIMLGHFECYISQDSEYVIPKSISFASMDQTQFDEFYENCLDIIVQRIIPGLGKRELAAEVESFL